VDQGREVAALRDRRDQGLGVDEASGWASGCLLVESGCPEFLDDGSGRLFPKSIKTPPFVSSRKRSFVNGRTFDGLFWAFVIKAPYFSVVNVDDERIIAEFHANSTGDFTTVNAFVQPDDHA